MRITSKRFCGFELLRRSNPDRFPLTTPTLSLYRLKELDATLALSTKSGKTPYFPGTSLNEGHCIRIDTFTG